MRRIACPGGPLNPDDVPEALAGAGLPDEGASVGRAEDDDAAAAVAVAAGPPGEASLAVPMAAVRRRGSLDRTHAATGEAKRNAG